MKKVTEYQVQEFSKDGERVYTGSVVYRSYNDALEAIRNDCGDKPEYRRYRIRKSTCEVEAWEYTTPSVVGNLVKVKY